MDALSTPSMMPAKQLTLGLSLRDEATFNNFYVGQHQEIISALKKTVMGQGERVIYLYGAHAQGKSHLLQACCHYAHQHHCSSVYLPLSDLLSQTPVMNTELLNGLETLSLVCFDDLQVLSHHPEWEEAIFHLYNRLHDNGGRMIFAASDLPRALDLKLADLVSRLAFGVIYALHPLSDEEKLVVLMMRAERRGILLSPHVGRYILTHCSRQMSNLVSALDALDNVSLAAQRRLTIPFVKEVLQI